MAYTAAIPDENGDIISFNDGSYDPVSNPGGLAGGGQVPNFVKSMSLLLRYLSGGAKGSSASSVAVGTGTKTFVLTNDMPTDPGAYVLIAYDASNVMHGIVTGHTAETKTIEVNVTFSMGAGTYADWDVYLSGPRGPQGEAGTPGNNTVVLAPAGDTAAGAAASVILAHSNLGISVTTAGTLLGTAIQKYAEKLILTASITASGGSSMFPTGASLFQSANDLSYYMEVVGVVPSANGCAVLNWMYQWNNGAAQTINVVGWRWDTTTAGIVVGTNWPTERLHTANQCIITCEILPSEKSANVIAGSVTTLSVTINADIYDDSGTHRYYIGHSRGITPGAGWLTGFGFANLFAKGIKRAKMYLYARRKVA